MAENIVYSVIVRKGPDRAHYDLVFEKQQIVLRYLGEYWEKTKPLRGLQRSMDLLLYRINKRKRRSTSARSVYDIVINYCDIVSIELYPPRTLRRRRRLAGRTVIAEEQRNPALVIVLRNGERLEVMFSGKVYDLVKRLLKRYTLPAVKRCGGRAGGGSSG